jgi:5-methylcytosine-specific restriction endonuclease McrA
MIGVSKTPRQNIAKSWHGSKWIRPEKRRAIYIRDKHTCAYCGQDLRGLSRDEITLDHITPRELGGSNKASNLVTSCRSCNCAKRDLTLKGFLDLLEKRGIDTREIPKRVRRFRRRSMKKVRKEVSL